MSSQKLSLPPNPSLPRAAVYMRSATCDDDQFHTLEQQTRLLAQQEGYDLVAFYTDVGSGWRSVEKRPGLQEMFSALQAGDFSILYIHDLSRLSRDSKEAWRLLHELKQAGLRGIRFLNQTSLHPGLFLQILLIFNEACTLYSRPSSEWGAQKAHQPFPLPEVWRQ